MNRRACERCVFSGPEAFHRTRTGRILELVRCLFWMAPHPVSGDAAIGLPPIDGRHPKHAVRRDFGS
jgi:hypothetical protein